MKILLVSESTSLRHEIQNLIRELQKSGQNHELIEKVGSDLLGDLKLEDYDAILFERRVWQRYCSIYRYFLGPHTFDRSSLIFIHRAKRGDTPKSRIGRKDVHLVAPSTPDVFARTLEESRILRDQIENASRFAQV